LFIKSLLRISTHTAPSLGEALVACAELSAYSNVAISVTKRKIYHMCVRTIC